MGVRKFCSFSPALGGSGNFGENLADLSLNFGDNSGNRGKSAPVDRLPPAAAVDFGEFPRKEKCSEKDRNFGENGESSGEW